jgi:flagellar protein FliO/FliZ
MIFRFWHKLAVLAGAATPLLWAALAWAGDKAASAPDAPASAPLAEMEFTGALVKMVGGLAGVLAILLLLYWLVRRFLPGQGIPLKSARMRVLGRLGLGQRSQVTMVQVGEKVLVLGVTPGSVTLLDKIDNIQELEEAAESKGASAGGFMDSLRRAVGKEEQGS